MPQNWLLDKKSIFEKRSHTNTPHHYTNYINSCTHQQHGLHASDHTLFDWKIIYVYFSFIFKLLLTVLNDFTHFSLTFLNAILYYIGIFPSFYSLSVINTHTKGNKRGASLGIIFWEIINLKSAQQRLPHTNS